MCKVIQIVLSSLGDSTALERCPYVWSTRYRKDTFGKGCSYRMRYNILQCFFCYTGFKMAWREWEDGALPVWSCKSLRSKYNFYRWNWFSVQFSGVCMPHLCNSLCYYVKLDISLLLILIITCWWKREIDTYSCFVLHFEVLCCDKWSNDDILGSILIF